MKILILEDQYFGSNSGEPRNKAKLLCVRLNQDGHEVYLFDGSRIDLFMPGSAVQTVRTWDNRLAPLDELHQWIKSKFRQEPELGVVIDFQIRDSLMYGVDLWKLLRQSESTFNLRGCVLSKSVGPSNRGEWSQKLGISESRIFSRMITEVDVIANEFRPTK